MTVVEWDTVFYQPVTAGDTTFIAPDLIVYWEDVLVVTEAVDREVVLVDPSTGEPRIRFGGKGQGPGEFQWISDVLPGDDGLLRVVDGNNRRLTAFSKSGEIEWERSLEGIGGAPMSGVVFGEVHLFTRIPATPAVFAFSSEGGVDIIPYPWTESIPERSSLASKVERSPDGDSWVAAFIYGPGFFVYTRGELRPHEFVIDQVPFRTLTSRGVTEQGDTVRFAARALQVSNERVFFLYGGQPRRADNPEGAPTVWLDIYSLEGAYEESWLLPGNTEDFAMDGERVFVLQSEPELAVMALHPKRN